MLGRGVKRKWSCVEQPDAEVVPAAVTGENEQNVEVSGESQLLVGPQDMSHLQQRQLVLGLCFQKLQRYQAGMELSLRRSVLLINTLRQIQEDMRSDVAGTCVSDILLNGVHTDSHLLREDMSVTCPGCAEGDGEGLSPSPSQELSSQEANSSPAATISACSDAVNAVGYLGDLALDDIFEDIDTSMCETSDLSAAWSAGSLWPVSVSLWAEEEVKMRAGGNASAGSLQSCLLDLNELDHIMEILVKS